MSVSRPSRVGDSSSTKPFPFFDHDIAEEMDRVDKRLEQLERAREKKKELEPQRRQEKFEKKWAYWKRVLHLSGRQELLFRSIDGQSLSVQTAIETVYTVKWDRLSERQRGKYFGRLRTLQYGINLKLKKTDDGDRVEILRGRIRIVRRRKWNRHKGRYATKPASPDRESKRESRVAECAEFLNSLLTEKYRSSFQDGWLPVAMLNDDARRAGFRPSTIENARKLLPLQSKKAKGYGSKGGWMVRLTVQKRVNS